MQAANRFLQGFPAGVVFPIGHHEQNFFLLFGMIPHVHGRGHDGIVERGSTSGFDLLQSLAQLIDVAGELLIEVVLVVKVDHEDLILRIAGAYQIQCRAVHLVPLLAHGAGVVDDDPHGDRNIFMPERSDCLRLVVLKNAERALVESRDQMVLVIHDRSVHYDLFDFLLEYKNAAIARRTLILRWLSLRLGWLRLLRWAGLSLAFLVLRLWTCG